MQERLRESAKAFDGLLSLIPAQVYYGEESNDQWKRTKHTKAEKKAAKLGKLDPDSEKNRTVQEVLEERARAKRKLEQVDDDLVEDDADQGGDDASLNLEGIEMEQPLKRQKTSEKEEEEEEKTPAANDAEAVAAADDDDESVKPLSSLSAKEQKKLAKRQKKLEKLEKKAAKTKESNDATVEEAEPTPKEVTEDESPRPTTEEDDRKPAPDSEMAPVVLTGLESKDGEAQSDVSSRESESGSPVFDMNSPANNGSVEPASAATSIASAAPSDKPKSAKLPSSTSDAFKARLAARIEELRKARKADGAEGKPAMTRQELIESRRQKQAQRTAHKKEVRRLAKEEADRKREEALASARTSPGGFMSPLRLGAGAGSDAGSDAGVTTNFAFGRIAFADGQQMSHDLSYVKDEKKKKGPSDPKTALAKLEAQKKRVAGLDEDKRKEVLEKETWLAARRRAEGEKVRDDETMLRKAVKRKEQAKKKSEREWGERKQGVEKAMRDRQKKREDNLRKRRDEKAAGKMGKKKKGGPTKPGGGGKRARPGFEGAGFGGGKRK